MGRRPRNSLAVLDRWVVPAGILSGRNARFKSFSLFTIAFLLLLLLLLLPLTLFQLQSLLSLLLLQPLLLLAFALLLPMSVVVGRRVLEEGGDVHGGWQRRDLAVRRGG